MFSARLTKGKNHTFEEHWVYIKLDSMFFKFQVFISVSEMKTFAKNEVLIPH